MGKVAEFVRSWGPAIFAVLFIRTFVFEPFRIPSGSMVPTLQIGDHVAVSKFSYGVWLPLTGVEIPFLDMLWVVPRYQVMRLSEPQRGDIVVFRFPRDESVNFIKRVVAVPGDRIAVENNRIVLNGELQPMEFRGKYDFIESTCQPDTTNRYVETLGELSHEALTSTSGRGGRLADMPERTVPEGHYFMMGDNRDASDDSRSWGLVREDQIKGKAHVVWLSWDGCKGQFGGIRMDRFFENLYSTPAE